jgi:tyrosine-protein phosphatase YwqE
MFSQLSKITSWNWVILQSTAILFQQMNDRNQFEGFHIRITNNFIWELFWNEHKIISSLLQINFQQVKTLRQLQTLFYKIQKLELCPGICHEKFRVLIKDGENPFVDQQGNCKASYQLKPTFFIRVNR